MYNILYEFGVEYDNLKPNQTTFANQFYLAQIKVNFHFWNKVVVNSPYQTLPSPCGCVEGVGVVCGRHKSNFVI